MKFIGMIADRPTPKIMVGKEIAFTMNSRDYKGVMLIVVAKEKEDGNSSKETHSERV